MYRQAQPICLSQLDRFEEIIIVAGSRDFHDFDLFEFFMDRFTQDLSAKKVKFAFLSGKADSGADAMIIEYCKRYDLPWFEMPALWDNLEVKGAIIKTNRRGKRYNARAGFDRNENMLAVASRLIAFWDGKSPGTRNMIDISKTKGITVDILLVRNQTDQDSIDQMGELNEQESRTRLNHSRHRRTAARRR